jgi:TrmH family RNA methyltransferase
VTEIITSTANPSVRWVKRLQKAKNRRAEGVALAEGVKAVRELCAQPERVVQLFWARPCLEKPGGRTLIDRLATSSIPHQEVAEHVLEAMADTQSPQGVLAVAKCAPATLDDLAQSDGDVLVLDGVQDPGNVGTLIRSVAASGGAGVVLARACSDPTGPKVVRAAAGAVFNVPYVVWDQPAEDLADALQAMGCRIAVARADGKSDPARVVDGGRIAWVMGAEGGGVSDALRSRADLSVAIPMAAGVESLNVAVAGSLLLYFRVFGKAGD